MSGRKGGQAMNELQLSKDLNVITAEINSYKQVAGQSIFEIGRRLKHVKESDLIHGEFGEWLGTIDMSNQQASRFIKVFEEIPHQQISDVGKMGLNALYEIATLPPEEREKEHVTYKGEVKKVDEMTNQELREVKRKLKQAERQAEIERKERERLEQQEPIIKEIDNTDYETIKKLENEIKKMSEKLQQESKDAETYRELQSDINNLRNRKDDMIRQIDNASTIGKFIARIDKSFEEDLAPIKYSRAIDELGRSEVVNESLNGIVSKVESWCREIRSLMKDKNITEVIDYE